MSAIYSLAVNAEQPLGEVFGGVFSVRRMGGWVARALEDAIHWRAEFQTVALLHFVPDLAFDKDEFAFQDPYELSQEGISGRCMGPPCRQAG